MPDNKNDNQPQVRTGILKRIADRIQGNTDSLYRSTYYSDIENKRSLQDITDSINASIKNIMDANVDNVGEPNISRLYERMFMNAQSDATTVSEFERIFGDNEFVNNLSNTYLDNRWVKALDQETDEVVKYMPKLQEALLTIRDNVLSADSFSKDFLNLETDSPTRDSAEQFSRNVEDMKHKYKLSKLTTEIYDDTSKYGEVFVYCVPYTKAIQRLLDRKDTNKNVVVRAKYHEGAVILNESTIYQTGKSNDPSYEDLGQFSIALEDGYISSIISSEKMAREKHEEVVKESLTEMAIRENSIINEGMLDINSAGGKGYAYDNTFDNDLNMGEKLPVHHKFDQTLGDSLRLPGDEDTTSDGLIRRDGSNGKVKEMNGCIIKKLRRECVIPITMNNDICLGYYYFEIDTKTDLYDSKYTTTGLTTTITGLRGTGKSEALDSMTRREELLNSIASNLAEKLDAKFINTNQDLKKEIYYILKYNDQFNAAAGSSNNIRISYIPPEDIKHFYFKLDENSKRGVSDLAMSLVPAKLWVAIYLTNCLAIMTRGNDKRVYYVRQSVETNISKTLLKTINEIKKSNFGIRQIESINSVLNITGRFNDYIIPRGADGQSPIEFEVMQGQNVEIKTDLLNILEEAAINVIGVPIEIIQNRQSPDYALQLTMSNSKFLRFAYARQSDFQELLSDFFTKIYNLEYSTNNRIRVTLPPPLFINITNTNQLIVNTNEYCENITNIMMGDSNNDIHRAKFSKELKKYYLGSYLNMAKIQELYDKSLQDTIKDTVSNPESISQDNQ